MKKTSLLFGIHMHQPVDNFDWVIEHGVAVCYAPFFEVMSRYPEFRFSVHCSGWLMEQIQTLHPKLYAQIQSMAQQGTIELVSAGYYEPILSVIPSEDRVGQIQKLNCSIEKQFDQTAKGLWLTERVWESALIPDLHRAGIRYTVMDDYHFQCAGFDEEVLDGYYMTEEGGTPLGLFPISKKLRYALPFLSVDRAMETIKSYNRLENSAAIIFDDAEKFGMWPGTHEWVYKKGWLEKFVKAVLADKNIETMHFRTYFESQKPRGIAYLPNVSYYEMGEWSLRASDAHKLERFKQEMGHDRYEAEGVKFLKGGIWKNFFVKYPESNRIHKRMLSVAKVRERMASETFTENLYKLQTNDALWHGVFGGLYLPNLRDTAYRYLIACENERYGDQHIICEDDNELNGDVKVKVVTLHYIFRFDAHTGGQLVEFDHRKARFNWQNTLARRQEAYHQRVLEPVIVQEQESDAEEGIDTIHHASAELDETLKDAIIYDWYEKNSFIDHISDSTFDRGSFRHCNFREYGDFANQPFECSVAKEALTFSREGGVYFPDKAEAHLKKRFKAFENRCDFEIDFSTKASQDLVYVLELNLHFAEYETLLINGKKIEDEDSLFGIKTFSIWDKELGSQIDISLDHVFDLHYFALKTLSQSETGFDLTIQGISIALAIPFNQALKLKGVLEIKDV